MYFLNIFLTPVPSNKLSFFLHNTLPYIHPRLNILIEQWRIKHSREPYIAKDSHIKYNFMHFERHFSSMKKHLSCNVYGRAQLNLLENISGGNQRRRRSHYPTGYREKNGYKVSELTLCILMDFPIQRNANRMSAPIIYAKGSQVDISKLGCSSVPKDYFHLR